MIALLLYVTTSKLFFKNAIVNQICGVAVNIIRSVPFIILLAARSFVTKIIAGTTIGPKAVVVPLTVTAVAFTQGLRRLRFLRLTEECLKPPPRGGAHPVKIIFGILIRKQWRGLSTVLRLPQYHSSAIQRWPEQSAAAG